MSRRIALVLAGAALLFTAPLFTAVAAPATATTLPPVGGPISGPLTDIQVEGPLFTSPLI
ncbi:hypothetical protein AMK26_25980 [Streptomyces sp. CB03234]|uniref:hypothetical protein n=1 Tax=Streptomyces sp. (strain CB03234) TaxID=1703937 RepID=UPI00093A5354|nr:hypothetical protein [Streptomyces sp. CB03234]OKJ99490.1 hypothetical protein AMK26_25980 [Streptomyces sp. CB03234]